LKTAIEGLQPKLVWEHFYNISQIPRESGNEKAVGEYIISVAKRNNLPYKIDKIGNIVVSQPGSAGREKRPMVVIQGHTDMVCEKNNDTVHDFAKDPIRLVRDGEWIKADGTTLGADNGIGVCCSLALMDDSSLDHPPMEYLFTVDEETGLTGAVDLSNDFLESRLLLNLDSEEEGAYYIGCAGGKHTIMRKKIEWEQGHKNTATYKLKLGGLRGGHSGLNIDMGLGNSIKLLSRFLYALKDKFHFHLAEINGGNKHNAIPREADAVIVIPADKKAELDAHVSEMQAIFKNELQFVDGDVFITIEDHAQVSQVFSVAFQDTLINLLYAMPHGVMAMSHAVEGLVETSTNMAILETKDGSIEMLTSQRSSVESAIIDIADKVRALGELAEFEVEQGGGYPAWQPNPDSGLLKLATSAYKELHGKEPEVKAIHAGLECGIIGEKFPGMDMLSFGPTITGAHSPDERVHIGAVESVWKDLLELLKRI
jgi:dipeptidase D